MDKGWGYGYWPSNQHFIDYWYWGFFCQTDDKINIFKNVLLWR